MRLYTVEKEGTAVTAAVDVLELGAADDKPIELIRLVITQSSDVKDAEEEMIRYQIIRGYTSSGTGGSSVTPNALDLSDSAAGFTCEAFNTGAATTGTPKTLWSDSFNIRQGLDLVAPAGAEWKTTQADGLLIVRLVAAPADSLTMAASGLVGEGQ